MNVCFCSSTLAVRPRLAWHARFFPTHAVSRNRALSFCTRLQLPTHSNLSVYRTQSALLTFRPPFLGNPIHASSFFHSHSSRSYTRTPVAELLITPKHQNKLHPQSAIAKTLHNFDNISADQNGSNLSKQIATVIQDAFPFKLDSFQLDALHALCSGNNVILSAPTGAGKTVVGEMAIYIALCRRMRVFYTTPLKALSNQKFYDFRRQFGDERVGLLTGDISINRDADIIVMTTEIYRNMLYGDSSDSSFSQPITDKLFTVVLDEFHYLNDSSRGTVWEESVIHSPEHVLLVALSATMSNASQIRDWFNKVQGPTALVTSNDRPVPLFFGYCDSGGLTPLFSEPQGNKSKTNRNEKGFGRRETKKSTSSTKEVKMHPKLLRRIKEASTKMAPSSRRQSNSKRDNFDEQLIMQKNYQRVADKNRGRGRDRMTEIPSFQYVVRLLKKRDMLPCIFFIFSRAGCDNAASMASSNRESLVSSVEADEIRTRLDAFVAENPGLIQLDRLNLAMKGICSHHAGLLPLWKICIEELFQDGLIKVVFATETLAAGINMPARTTVISALSKRAGEEGFADLTTSQVLQMAGRAGRRGKDIVGHSIIMRSRHEGARDAFKVLTAGVDALESKFTPNYGMVLNLLSSRPLKDAKKLVDRSFGTFLREKLLLQESGNELENNGSEVRMREKQALEAVLGKARDLASSIDQKPLRSYMKSIERVKAEQRALSYLVRQSTETDAEIIEDTLTFAPAGTRLLLKERGSGPSIGAERRQKRREYSDAMAAAGSGDMGERLTAYYLSSMDSVQVEFEQGNEKEKEEVVEAVFLDIYDETGAVSPMFVASDANGNLRLFNNSAVAKLFYEEEPVEIEKYSPEWSDVVIPGRSQWKSIAYDQFSAPLPVRLEGLLPVLQQWKEKRLISDATENKEGTISGLADMNRPEILAQKDRIRHAQAALLQHELHSAKDIGKIIAAKRAVPQLEGILNGTIDPFSSRRRKGKPLSRYASAADKQSDKGKVENGILQDTNWDDFMNLVSVLQHYGFVDDSYNVTSLGSLGAKVRGENELWTSLVLLEPSLDNISPLNLGAFLGATLVENSRPDTYIAQEVSREVIEYVDRVAPLQVRLSAVQNEFQVGAPIYLDAELMGLVEMWSSGMSWVELLRNTSLHEGDSCRILRRVLDLLRQISHLPVVSERLKRNSKRAIALLDRFPITDDRTYVVRGNEKEEEYDV